MHRIIVLCLNRNRSFRKELSTPGSRLTTITQEKREKASEWFSKLLRQDVHRPVENLGAGPSSVDK